MHETDKTVTFTPAEVLVLWLLFDAGPIKGQADQRELMKAWDQLHLDDVTQVEGQIVLPKDYAPPEVAITEAILKRIKRANEEVMTSGGRARLVIAILDKCEAALKGDSP